MNKTGIEYARGNDGRPGYAWNFYVGCKHKEMGLCPVPHCWAEGMSKRHRDFHKPHLIPKRLLAPLSLRKPSRILVNFMGDLMGDWVDPEEPIGQMVEKGNALTRQGWRLCADVPLRRAVITVAQACPQHTFIFLTKNPAGYAKWGQFPDNAWLGATAWDAGSMAKACFHLGIAEAKVKFLSLEPLLGQIIGSAVWGSSALKPVDTSRIPIWRWIG